MFLSKKASVDEFQKVLDIITVEEHQWEADHFQEQHGCGQETVLH